MKKLILITLLSLVFNCGGDQKKGLISYAQNNDLKASIARGQELYNDLCITCHLASGEGVEGVFPPLANSDYLKNNQDLSIKAIKYGMSGEIIVNGVSYNGVMTPQGLSAQEVADVMNYINNSWGNKFGPEVTSEKVTKISQ